MIKFFRKIRYDLMYKNKTGKYIKYAIGEIILVMIGILLALQVNNWNSDLKDQKLASHYLRDLKSDLRKDSLQIKQLIEKSNSQILSKLKLQKYLLDSTDLTLSTNNLIEYLKTHKEFTYDTDSIISYFRSQFIPTYDFTPITTTIDEMKNTGNIGVIKNDSLRRQIIETYNQYDTYKSNYEYIYNRNQLELIRAIRPKVSSIFIMKSDEIKKVMCENEIFNGFESNYVFGINNGLLYLKNANHQLLYHLNAIKK